MPMKEEKHQFNVYLTSDIIRQIKHRSIDENVSLSDLVEKIFTAYITQPQNNAQVQESQPVTEHVAIAVQPMLHVEDMSEALAFFQKLGAKVLNGSRDDDWALLSFGSTELGILAHPANEEQDEGKVELNFEYHESLEELEKHLRAEGVPIVRATSDEGFGAQLQLAGPDGLLIKVNQIDSSLYS